MIVGPTSIFTSAGIFQKYLPSNSARDHAVRHVLLKLLPVLHRDGVPGGIESLGAAGRRLLRVTPGRSSVIL
jgi:hypothetical protein